MLTQRRRRLIAAWSLAGVGALTLAAGGGLGGAALHANNDAASDAVELDASRSLSSARNLQLGANLCFGIGGVIAGAGTIWGIYELVRNHHHVEHNVRAAR